jgi:hypothetical protein
MFSFFIHGIVSTIVVAFFYLDGHYIVKNTIVIKWKKFRKINKLVATNYKGCFNIIWISARMVVQALWVSIIQYLNSTIVKLDGNKYRVTYIIKGKTYKMIVKPKRGPQKILCVFDETETEVSHVIFPFLGPEENFHGKMYTPRFFEKEELIFELSNGNEKIFKSDDNIVI